MNLLRSVFLGSAAVASAACLGSDSTPYEPNWDSLAKHEAAPEWFQDAKFGIYFHWGVYSVPAYGSEWYPRFMHMEEHPVAKHHREKYGHPSEFGYHDFVPQFTAEHFDPEEWADLFRRAGARFAGPVAEHHDGFSMWDSEVTPWNAMDKGPKRDIAGELEDAVKDRGMKFITTFHHARNLQRHDPGPDNRYRTSHYPFHAGMPPTSDDPELRYLYGNIPEEQWLEEIWLGKLTEVVDKYSPDIMWFDSWLDRIPEQYRQRFCAYYLNHAKQQGKEVVIIRKQDDLPLSFTVDDLEKSRKNELAEDPWMTDETVSTGSWSYTEGLEIKPPIDVLHVLIDIVSKNGVLLLNISPKADGTIPQEQKDVLFTIGEWLDHYGEAIYGTRPWYIHGEGPTVEPEGPFKHHEEFLKIKYSPEDVRYTTKENKIYAMTMGKPDKKQITLASFAPGSMPQPIEITSVRLMGSKRKLKWSLGQDGLHIRGDFSKANELAMPIVIETKPK